ncbi:MAG: hypothetical protein Q9162_001403 [Coniocarpon cinnabarinum]
MDVFICGITDTATDHELESVLLPHLRGFGIESYELKRLVKKACAILTLPSTEKGHKFLDLHGKRPGLRGNYRVPAPLKMNGRPLYLEEARDEADVFVVRRLQKTHGHPASTPHQKSTDNLLKVASLDNGYLDHGSDGQLSFHRCYHDARNGSFVLGRNRLLVKLEAGTTNPENVQVLIHYNIIERIYIGSKVKPTLIFVLRQPPMFYNKKTASNSDALTHFFDRMGISDQLASSLRTKSQDAQLHRICDLGHGHVDAVSTCFVYYVNFADHPGMTLAVNLLQRERSAPNPARLTTSIKAGIVDYRHMYNQMRETLDREVLPFSVKFQLQRLVENGILTPHKISQLCPHVSNLWRKLGDEIRLAEGIRALAFNLPFAGPEANGQRFQLQNLLDSIEFKAAKYQKRGSMYQVAQRHEHVGLIYRVSVSPSGTWLEGPVPETKNRVLRKYEGDISYFLRVEFCDEDGEQLRYERKVNRDNVFGRFQSTLRKGIRVAGRTYSFLGFSHSSLRTQSCWFMAPFFNHDEDTLMIPKNVIENLGDFSSITCPAKCAARIGQAFSDATDTIPLHHAKVESAKDVWRNGRCFSDGNGTISYELLRMVHRKFFQSRKAYATVIQIRFQGCKGVLALDAGLQGMTARFRDSMNKFPAPNHLQLEITGAAYKPLPLYLNRQFIVIMESLGVPAQSFLDLQQAALKQIERMTQNPINAAVYLEFQQVGTAIGLDQLLRSLYDNGFHFQDDPFLLQTIEMATRVQLRELKHKARIPVPDGHTLFGIMDETGTLGPNQVYVIIKEDRKSDTVCKVGRCFVTRAPAMHPGDIQEVYAVEVPAGSATSSLHNCIVFSQLGERDVPSMLSGGDLDGDLYNVIFDETLFPRQTCSPAEYPRPTPVDIGRPVTTEDMSDHFLMFMEQDRLGSICNTHMVLADYKEDRVFDQDCIKLAELASTAVDFSKTGIPALMTDFPKVDRRRRPDFMAPAPHLVLDANSASMALDDEMDYHGLPDDIDEALELETGGYRYYKSQNVLGKLYRNIDETKFIEKITTTHGPSTQEDSQAAASKSYTFIKGVLDHVRQLAVQVHWDTPSNRIFANDVRHMYESHLADLMYHYSPYRYPLSELEVFCGTILGRDGSTPNRRARESTTDMKDAFGRLARYTIRCVKSGEMQDLDKDLDSDENDDGSSTIDLEITSTMSATVQDERTAALQRSIACLATAIEEPGQHFDRQVGYLRSFPYLVAGVCLRQVQQYQDMMRRFNRRHGQALGAARSTVSGRRAAAAGPSKGARTRPDASASRSRFSDNSSR